MYGYIYLTTNLINGKQYVGQHQATTFEFTKYKGSGTYLQRAFKKYGRQNFNCCLLEICEDQEELNQAEEKWIQHYNAVESKSFYNIAAGAYGIKKTAEHRKHLSEAWTDERRKALGDRVKGDKNPSKRPEVRLKKSANNSSHRPEIRKKISESKKGIPHPHTKEQNRKISEALKGRQIMVFTDEVKRKISDSKRGKCNPMYGKSAVKGSRWYNNGQINRRAYECPEGFVLGKVKHNE